jgi:hypothetical protein
MSHRSGFVPWHLEPFELDVMLAILRGITPFAIALRDNPKLWLGDFPDDCFKHEIPVFDARAGSPAGHPCEWRAWNVKRLPTSQGSIAPAPETRQAMAQLRQTPVAPDMHLEVAVLDMGVIAEPPRPYPARLLLVADSKSGMIVYNHMLQKTENAAVIFLSMFTEYIKTSQRRPLSVKIADYQTANAIGNVLDGLGVKLSLVERLPVIENMQNMMTRGFR